MRRSLRTFELIVMASLFYSLPVPSKCKSLFLCNGADFLWSAQRSTCFCANNAADAVCTFASAIKAWTHTHTHTGFVHFIKLSHGMQAAVINCGGLGAAAINRPRCLRPTNNCNGRKNSFFAEAKILWQIKSWANKLREWVNSLGNWQRHRVWKQGARWASHVRVHTWRGTQAKVFAVTSLSTLMLFFGTTCGFSLITVDRSMIDLIISWPLQNHEVDWFTSCNIDVYVKEFFITSRNT